MSCPAWAGRWSPLRGRGAGEPLLCRAAAWGGGCPVCSVTACRMSGLVSVSLRPPCCQKPPSVPPEPCSHELVALRLGWHSWGPALQEMAPCLPPVEGTGRGLWGRGGCLGWGPRSRSWESWGEVLAGSRQEPYEWGAGWLRAGAAEARAEARPAPAVLEPWHSQPGTQAGPGVEVGALLGVRGPQPSCSLCLLALVLPACW